MAGLTFSQLKARVAVNLQDVDQSGVPTYTAWPEAWIGNWVNDAITEVCADAQLIKQYVTFAASPIPVIAAHATAEYVPFVSTVGVDSPTTPDMFNLDEIIMLQAGVYPLRQVTATEAAEMYQDWDTRTGTPLFFIFNDFAPGVVKLIPDPDEVLTTVRGIVTLKPALLTGASQIPVIDPSYHVAVEYKATARALMMEGENRDDAAAARWEGLYQAKIAKLKAKQARNFSRAPREVVTEWF